MRDKGKDRTRSKRYYYHHRDEVRERQRIYRESNREYFRRRNYENYWRPIWSRLGKTEEEIQQWINEHYKPKSV